MLYINLEVSAMMTPEKNNGLDKTEKKPEELKEKYPLAYKIYIEEQERVKRS